MNVLFVCHGNICRSPMAEGLAKERLGPGDRVESAGLAPMGEHASEDAVWVLKTVFRVDISGHRPRSVGDVDLDDFDFVIALDAAIYARLKSTGRVTEDRLYGWDIEDPYGQGLSAYVEAGKRIRERLIQFLRSHGLE